VLEINPLPGLHPTHSDLPMIWTAVGRPYPGLIERIVASAAARSVPLASGAQRGNGARAELQ
jgi:D-alanine-D-alanine ligase